MVSISEIAARAGVSTGTVSMALNADPKVRPETREKIQKVARELGYRPNASARALKKSLSEYIGLIPAGIDLTSSVVYLREYAPLVDRLVHVLESRGCHLVVGPPVGMRGAEGEALLPRIVEQSHVARAIFLSHMWPKLADELRQYRIPCVVIDGPSFGLPAVQRDEAAAVEMLVDHLADMGHRRIAFVNHAPPGPRSRYRDELWPMGYFRAITRHQLVPVPGWDLFEEPEAGLARLLSLPEPPTALIAYDDPSADQLIRLLNQRGLSVPENISVTAVSDLGEVSSPVITRVVLSHKAMADLAVEKLMAEKVGPEIMHEASKLPGRLIVGQTTGEIKVSGG